MDPLQHYHNHKTVKYQYKRQYWRTEREFSIKTAYLFSSYKESEKVISSNFNKENGRG